MEQEHAVSSFHGKASEVMHSGTTFRLASEAFGEECPL